MRCWRSLPLISAAADALFEKHKKKKEDKAKAKAAKKAGAAAPVVAAAVEVEIQVPQVVWHRDAAFICDSAALLEGTSSSSCTCASASTGTGACRLPNQPS